MCKGQFLEAATPLSDGASCAPLLDRERRLVTSPGLPAIAGDVLAAAASVGTSAAALSGSYPSGVTILNVSTGGQTVYLGPAGVTTSSGFPLEPGASVARGRWQDLSVVFAVASGAGAELRFLGL